MTTKATEAEAMPENKTPENAPQQDAGNGKENGGAGPRIGRRALLAGSAAAATAAGLGARGANRSGEADDVGEAPDPSDHRRVSYRETNHIRQFYARARF